MRKREKRERERKKCFHHSLLLVSSYSVDDEVFFDGTLVYL